MGIPSFYKHLLQTITGLTSKTRVSPKLFALDLNCAIYHCVKKLQRIIPYTDDNRTQWESRLIDYVIAYIKQLNNIVKPTETLYIAVDGVAPMAKIKQQRMRRFKSAKQAQEEARIRAEAKGVPYVAQPRWDQNAITPGTQFMAALTLALRNLARTKTHEGATIVVSPADEPGEGEQKIMVYVRKHLPSDVVVYGLDADLIVLSLAGSTLGIQMDLFREEVEFSGVKENIHGEEQFLFLSINTLAETLARTYRKPEQSITQFITDFVALMSILGNDFVPHGMGLKIKDEGVERLLDIYKNRVSHTLLLDTYSYNPAALRELFTILAEEEPRELLKGIRKKLNARVGMTSSKDPEEQALARFNDQPVLWAAERNMIQYVDVPGYERPQMTLREDWTVTYDKEALWGADPQSVSKAYMESLAWTLAYYMGAPIDTEWYYPWPLPPRAKSIAQLLETQTTMHIPHTQRNPLKPHEQLAMVLPESSFHLLPREYAALPFKYPHAWPVAWASYSFGRRFLWECEPQIPLVQPEQIRQWIEMMYDE